MDARINLELYLDAVQRFRISREEEKVRVIRSERRDIVYVISGVS